MKILQVFDFLSLPHGGGTVDVISKLSKALMERGHEVTLWTGDHNTDYKLISDLGVKYRVFGSHFNRYGWYVMSYLKHAFVGDFDVIHFHCYRSYMNSVLYRNAIRDGVPYVIDAHGSTADKGPKNLLRKAYDLAWGYDCLKHASKVIAETEVGVAEWKKLGVLDSKITLLHPFIDTHEFENLPPKVGGVRYILFLGRLHKDKGLEFLLRSFAELRKTRHDVVLCLVGQDNGYRNTIEKLIEELKLAGSVSVWGFAQGVEKIEFLTNASMLIQPSRNEAGARPSLEALMCGTPVIVTENTGAGLEIAKMDAGYLARYGISDDLFDAMRLILDSPELAQAKIKKGQDYIRANLSLESQIPKYENLYREVMK